MAIGDGIGLLFSIKAESSQATAELSKFRGKVSSEVKAIEGEAAKATSAFSGLGSSISDLINPTNLLAGAGIAAGAALLSMAKSAFDAAGQLFDLSQKTNFSVESLSALKNAAETSGSSIESISTALGIFQKNQEAANQGNKKLSETFQRLNIDTHSNEQGLRDAFKALAEMAEGEEQTALAMEVFGKSGKDVLGVIKETNGNLDEAIAKYKEMGTLISTETAKAADEMGDSLTSAGQKAKALAVDLLTALKPALEAILLIVNGVAWALDKLAKAVAWLIDSGYLDRLKAFSDMVERVKALSIGSTATASVQPVAQQAIRIAEGQRPADLSGGGAEGPLTFSSLGLGAKRGGSSRVRMGGTHAATVKGPEDFGVDFLKQLTSQAESAQKAFDNLTGTSNVQRAALEILDDKYKGLSDSTRNQILATAALIDRWKEQADKQKALQKATTDFTNFVTKQNEEVEKLTGTEKTHYDLVIQAIEAADRQGVSLKGVNLQLLQMNGLLLDSASHWKEIVDLANKHAADVFGNVPFQGGGEDNLTRGDRNRGVAGQIDVLMGGEKPPDFKPHMDAIGALRDFATEAWGDISSGFGNMIEAFLTGGNQAGISFGKMAKAAIASVTAQAAVHAIFEVGMALASMWLNPAEAASHWLAAETFGLVAGVGAAAALAIPGGSGGQASAAGVPTSGTSRNGNGSTSPIPRDVGRTTANSTPQIIELHIKSNDSHIVETFIKDWMGNGKVRTVVKADGMLAA